MSNIIRGRCLCGGIQYEARGDPLWVAHCHCNSCRRSTGAPVTTFVGFKSEELSYTRGKRKLFNSSPGVRRGFCAECGTPLTYEADRCSGEVHVYVSTLDNPGDFHPQLHVFYAEHIPWLELEDDLPRYEASSKATEPASWGPKHK